MHPRRLLVCIVFALASAEVFSCPASAQEEEISRVDEHSATLAEVLVDHESLDQPTEGLLFDPADYEVLPEDLSLLFEVRERLQNLIAIGGSLTLECWAAADVFNAWVEYASGINTDMPDGLDSLPDEEVARRLQTASSEAILLCEDSSAPLDQDLVFYFGHDQFALSEAANETLAEVAQTVQTIAQVEGVTPFVSVTGHTDTSQDTTYNQGLSQRRAQAVANRLASLGVTVGSIGAVGESEPAVPTGEGVKEPLNRRAVVEIRSLLNGQGKGSATVRGLLDEKSCFGAVNQSVGSVTVADRLRNALGDAQHAEQSVYELESQFGFYIVSSREVMGLDGSVKQGQEATELRDAHNRSFIERLMDLDAWTPSPLFERAFLFAVTKGSLQNDSEALDASFAESQTGSGALTLARSFALNDEYTCSVFVYVMAVPTDYAREKRGAKPLVMENWDLQRNRVSWDDGLSSDSHLRRSGIQSSLGGTSP